MTAPKFAFIEQLPLQRYHVRLLKEIRAIVGDPVEAQDIVQSTWLQLLESIGEVDSLPDDPGVTGGEWDGPEEDAPGARVFGWLRCVSRRRAADAVRSRERRQERMADYRPDLAVPADPSEAIVRREEDEHVRRVLRRLPRRQAQLLRMTSDRCTYSQTAAAIGIADSSVGPLYLRARRAFVAMNRRMEAGSSRHPVVVSCGHGQRARSYCDGGSYSQSDRP